MRREKLFQDALDGDEEAFIEWSRDYCAMLSQFGYQAGVPADDLPAYQRKVLRFFNGRLKTVRPDEAEHELYKTAIDCLERGEQADPPALGENPLSFEEDMETHRAMQELGIHKKLPFALFYFHSKSLEEIAILLNEPKEKLELYIHSAKGFITEKLQLETSAMVEKRLELLHKSYRRFSVPPEEEKPFSETTSLEENTEAEKPVLRPPVKKGTASMLALAGFFLAAVVGASFVFNDPNPKVTTAEEEDGTVVTKRMVKEWEKEYELIRKNSPGLLGIDEKVYEELAYVKGADELKERTFSRANVKKLKDNPKEMENQVNKLMFHINTPKGMREALTDSGRISAEDTAQFVHSYIEKTDQLMAVADGLFEKYREELNSAAMNGELSAEKLEAQPEDYPEEVSRLIKALYEHTLTVAVHPNDNRFRTIREVDLFYHKNPFNHDYYAMEYMQLLGAAPYFDETGFLVPPEHLAYVVTRTESLLLEIDKSNPMYEKLASILQHSFFAMLKGDEHTAVFDNKGIVKEEFQTLWKSVIYNSRNPVTFLLTPIITEMEESGWTESGHYDQLAYPDILTALDMELNGNLAQQMPNGDVQVDNENLTLADFDYSEMEDLYKEFKADYDRQVLSGVKPSDILMLYYYANKIEDPETMWHLLADDHRKPSGEEYLTTWEQLPDIGEEYSSLEIFNDSVMRIGNSLHLTIYGTRASGSDYMMSGQNSPTLVTESDHIWLLKYQITESYKINEEETAYADTVISLYEKAAAAEDEAVLDSASPGEIAGLFLLAVEKENIPLVRMLVAQTDSEVSEDQTESWMKSFYLPKFTDITKLAFYSDMYDNNTADQMTGSAEFEFIQDEIVSTNMVWMVKQGSSWRIDDMYSY